MKFKNILVGIFFLSSIILNANTYEIEEQDLITEIEKKAPELEKKLEKQKKIVIEKVENMTGEIVPKATENRIKYIDPTYTLDRDIPRYSKFGKYEGVLYKKGYTFNPIEYMNVLPPDFIIFNPCDNNESKYIKKLVLEYEEKVKDYMLVNSGCKNRDLKKTEFSGKVYFLTKEMKDKFKIEHTISVIYVDKDKKRIAIKEVAVNEKNIN